MQESHLFNSAKFAQQLRDWYANPAGQMLSNELLNKLEQVIARPVWLLRFTSRRHIE